MTTDRSSKGLLADRVAFVTGAARGIGRAIAQRYVEEGASVVQRHRGTVRRIEELLEQLDELLAVA